MILFKDGESSKDSPPITNVTDSLHEDDEREVPSVIIYLVEPFTLGSDQPELQRVACLALLRCYQSILSAIPDNVKNNISVQVNKIYDISVCFLTCWNFSDYIFGKHCGIKQV